jgi:hypothetical protein
VDLRHVAPLTAPVGAFATVYLDVTHDTENAAQEGRLRWSEQRSALEEQGADAETLEALDEAISDARPAVGRAGRVLVARAGTLLLDRDLPEPPDPARATWSPLPDLLSLLLDGSGPDAARRTHDHDDLLAHRSRQRPLPSLPARPRLQGRNPSARGLDEVLAAMPCGPRDARGRSRYRCRGGRTVLPIPSRFRSSDHRRSSSG